MTPIGSEMMVSTLPDFKTFLCTCSFSTIPLTTRIFSRICEFVLPLLAELMSFPSTRVL